MMSMPKRDFHQAVNIAASIREPMRRLTSFSITFTSAFSRYSSLFSLHVLDA
jgi:hypothetical protein